MPTKEFPAIIIAALSSLHLSMNVEMRRKFRDTFIKNTKMRIP
jgi:hypothetical protein